MYFGVFRQLGWFLGDTSKEKIMQRNRAQLFPAVTPFIPHLLRAMTVRIPFFMGRISQFGEIRNIMLECISEDSNNLTSYKLK